MPATKAAPKAAPPAETVIHILWINAGLSCDGDSVALTAATQPSIEEIALQALPGLPKIAVHWPLIDYECGPVGGADDFSARCLRADRGERRAAAPRAGARSSASSAPCVTSSWSRSPPGASPA